MLEGPANPDPPSSKWPGEVLGLLGWLVFGIVVSATLMAAVASGKDSENSIIARIAFVLLTPAFLGRHMGIGFAGILVAGTVVYGFVPWLARKLFFGFRNRSVAR